jgi:DNA-binding beta-propeller fold protein YncE
MNPDPSAPSREPARPAAALAPALAALALAALVAPLGAQEEDLAAAEEEAGPVVRTHQTDDLELRMEVAPLEDRAGPVREGENLELRLRVTRRSDEEPVPAEPPAVWIDHRRQEEPTGTEACRARVADFLKEKMKHQAAVNLSSYYVLSLNRGNNISVLSPFFGMGSTQTVTTVRLPGEGADWALGPDERHLYVTIPERNLVAVVSTDTWDVVEEISLETRPVRIRIGPDRRTLWVALDGGGERSGVVALDAAERSVIGRIEAGSGPHRVTFSPDGATAWIASEGAGVVTAADVSTLEELAVLETGPAPASLDASSVSGRLYVVDREDGSLTLVDLETHEVTLRMDGTPGKNRIRFDPSGRWGFVLNPEAGEVLVLDADADRIRHGFVGEGEPYQVGFTEGFAYVRSRGIVDVAMISLKSLEPGGAGAFARDFGSQGEEMTSDSGLRAVSFPAGQEPPGEFGDVGPASPFAKAPHKHDALYVAAPGDKALYFYHYMEGMPTPAGTLKTYAFEPKAAMVVGRKVDEVGPGEYRAVVEAPRAGPYELVFALDDPRVIHCFPFEIADAPRVADEPGAVELEIEALGRTVVPAGEATTVRFQLRERGSGEARTGIRAEVRVTSPTGYREVLDAESSEDGGYGVDLHPPSPGIYYLTVALPELRKGHLDTFPLIVRAVEGAADVAGGGRDR